MHICMCIFLAQDASCDNCISTRTCRTTTGNYALQFTKLFIDHESNSPCELEYSNGTLVPDASLMEGRCIELLPNSNYTIRCPICQDNYDILYVLLITNDIENCSSLGKHWLATVRTYVVSLYVNINV